MAMAHGLFATLQAHPGVVPLLGDRIPLDPHGLTGREAMLSTLTSGGFAPEIAVRAYTAVSHHVIGFAGQLRTHGPDSQQDEENLREYFRSLDPARFPATVNAVPFTPIPLDHEFQFGPRLIVDGLAARSSSPA